MSEAIPQIEKLSVWIEANHAKLSDFCVEMLIAQAWKLKQKENRVRCLEVLRPVAESRNLPASYRDHKGTEYITAPAQKSHSQPNWAALPESQRRLIRNKI